MDLLWSYSDPDTDIKQMSAFDTPRAFFLKGFDSLRSSEVNDFLVMHRSSWVEPVLSSE